MPPPDGALGDFVAGARAFLDDQYPRRRDGTAQSFHWGEGLDTMTLFPSMSDQDRAAEVAAAKQHRATLFDAGYGWITGPVEYGGRGLPGAYDRAFAALLREYQVPPEGVFTIGLGMVSPTILAHGTDTAKHRYLRRLWRGDAVGCQLFSEPGAGSDLASVATAAVPSDDGGWRITGQKVWTSEAQASDVGLALCRTSPGPRHRNLTAFVIDMHAAGVEVRPLRQMTGGAAFNEVFLDDVGVADDDRLGEVGGGWQVARTTLMNERTSVGGLSLGGQGVLSSERLKQLARTFDVDRDPVARQRLARVLTMQRIGRYTRQRLEAQAMQGGREPGPLMSMLKLQLSANFTAVAEFASQVLGPRITADTGEWGTYAWAELLLGAPGYRIGGGTDEILKNVLAERVLGLPPEPVPVES